MSWSNRGYGRYQRLVSVITVLLLHWLFLTILCRNIDPIFNQGTASVLHVVLIDPVSNKRIIPKVHPVTDVAKAAIMDRSKVAPTKPQLRNHKNISIATNTNPEVNEQRFFNIDGSLNIPKDLMQQIDKNLPKPQFKSAPIATPEFMQHRRMIKLRPTLFEPYWAGTNETLLAEFGRRNLIKEKIFKTESGVRIGCIWMVILFTCAEVPPPAWKPPTHWQPRQSEADE